MKKLICIIFCLMAFQMQFYAQNQPAVISPGQAAPFWRMGTNNTNTPNNTFGFGGSNSNPLYFATRNTVRMKMNSTYTGNTNQYPINGFNWPAVNTSGYVGIGENTNNFWSTKGPYSLLHLNGAGPGVQEFGYRPWMKTGITFTSNSDLMYIGHRQIGTGYDITEAVLVWSDNAFPGSIGPDDMVFRFTSGNGQTNSADMCTPEDLDGRHIARFTGDGRLGLGPTFSQTFRPQSHFHMTNCSNMIVFAQWTNQAIGEQSTDGLKIGILNQGMGMIYNQENRSLLLSTAEIAPTSETGNTRERIRISATGIDDTPVTSPINRATRIGISHNPAEPLTRPRSLLHLGYNTGPAMFPNMTDGWRSWMDVGMFIAQGTDNMYIGLRNESGTTTDRRDAVINWGDNPQASPPFNNQGPDNLRFIFTSTQDGFSQMSPANTEDGLEIARMTPMSYVGIGPFFTNPEHPRRRLDIHDDGFMLGTAPNNALPNTINGRPQLRLSHTIGTSDNACIYTDFQTTGDNNSYGPGNLLINPRKINNQMGFVSINMINATTPQFMDLAFDVNGQVNIRTVEQDNSLTQVLVWDPASNGRVRWRSLPSVTGGFGVPCPSTNPSVDGLQNNTEVPLNNYNFIFSGQGAGNHRVGIGLEPLISSCTPDAKLHVRQSFDNIGIFSEINSTTFNSRAISARAENSTMQIGIDGLSLRGENQIGVRGVAIEPIANNQFSIGVQGISRNFTSVMSNNYGGFFVGHGSTNNNNQDFNFGVYGQATGNAKINFGGYFLSNATTGPNYAIFATVTNCIWPPCSPSAASTPNFAAYLSGDVHVTGTPTFGSDEQLKDSISEIANPLQAIRKLNPKSFTYKNDDYHYLNLPFGTNYGFIAQEVDTIYPELVKDIFHPATYDSLGNIVTPELWYKGLNYNGLIPISIAAIKDLDQNLTELTARPNSPLLISPQNGDTVTPRQQFFWHKTENTMYYIVEYSLESDMSNIMFSQTAIDTTVFFRGNIDTTYYWAVKSVNAFGESAYSEIRNFFYISGYTDRKEGESFELSDIHLKTNIIDVENAIQTIMQLQGVHYEWNSAQHPHRNLPTGNQIGFIAQEVETILPEVVGYDENGYAYINYDRIVPVLNEAVKELYETVDSLQTKIDSYETRFQNIETMLSQCCNNDKNEQQPSFSQTVTVSNQKAIVLNQNSPNPFKEQTSITFQIPEYVKSAQIVFIDNLGNILNQVEITERGYGELIVYAQDLSSGLYTYYLVADGKTVESKKMVVAK